MLKGGCISGKSGKLRMRMRGRMVFLEFLQRMDREQKVYLEEKWELRIVFREGGP